MKKCAERGYTYRDEVNGYIVECVVGHSLFPNKRWVYQHRRVLAEKIGRKLKSWEIVHHKDENGFNNNPNNLELTTRKNHPKLHKGIKRTEEVKRKMSVAARARCTPAWRAAVSKRVLKQHKEGRFGIHWTKRRK